MVEFDQIAGKLYNLAFGDVNEYGELDDMIVTNNKDTAEVLATVIQAVLTFFEVYSDAAIYFKGSTLARTRLYQIVLGRELTNWNDTFTVYGLRNNQKFPFELGAQFEAFVIKLKNT
jgi:hypothetical protein